MSPTLTTLLTHLSELAHWRIALYFAEKEEKRRKIPQPKAVDDSPLARLKTKPEIFNPLAL